MADKVYCSECKYITIVNIVEDACNALSNFRDTYYKKNGERIEKPNIINQYNNCKMFVSKMAEW